MANCKHHYRVDIDFFQVLMCDIHVKSNVIIHISADNINESISLALKKIPQIDITQIMEIKSELEL